MTSIVLIYTFGYWCMCQDIRQHIINLCNSWNICRRFKELQDLQTLHLQPRMRNLLIEIWMTDLSTSDILPMNPSQQINHLPCTQLKNTRITILDQPCQQASRGHQNSHVMFIQKLIYRSAPCLKINEFFLVPPEDSEKAEKSLFSNITSWIGGVVDGYLGNVFVEMFD